MENKTETPTQALTPEEKIKNGLAKNNLAEQAIEQLKTDYKDLKVKDVNDIAGYETVRKARLKVRDVRLGIEKYCDAAGRNAYDYYKACLSEKKRYLGLIGPLEDQLLHEEEFIDREKEKIRVENEEKEKARRHSRIQALIALGMNFDGVDLYRIEFEEQVITLDQATINHLSDELFKTAIEGVMQMSSRITSAKARKIAEQEAIAQGQKEEAIRLQAIAEENRKKEQALLAKEKELLAAEMKAEQAKQEALRAEEAKKQEAIRIEQAKKQAVIDAENKKKAEIEQARKKELRRSDKTRLIDFAKTLPELTLPTGLKSSEAEVIIAGVKSRLSALSAYIVTETNKL